MPTPEERERNVPFRSGVVTPDEGRGAVGTTALWNMKGAGSGLAEWLYRGHGRRSDPGQAGCGGPWCILTSALGGCMSL